MTIVFGIVAAMLLIAALLTMVRMMIGPNTLDRIVALDVLIALIMCGLALWIAYSHDTSSAPAIVALTLLSFIASVAVARFRVRDDQT